MHFVLTTEQQVLVQSARDYCSQYGTSKIIREQMSGVGDYLRNNWDKVCQELGCLMWLQAQLAERSLGILRPNPNPIAGILLSSTPRIAPPLRVFASMANISTSLMAGKRITWWLWLEMMTVANSAATTIKPTVDFT